MKKTVATVVVAVIVSLQSWVLLEVVTLKTDVARLQTKVDILKFRLE